MIQKLKQELANHTVGPQVNYFCGTFLAPIKDVERIKNKELGGGAVLELETLHLILPMNYFDYSILFFFYA